MAQRNTRADVERIVASINEAAKELGLRGAGKWSVETLGGTYLYLTDRTFADESGPGEQIEPLGSGWHSAYERLFTLRRDLLTVQIRREA